MNNPPNGKYRKPFVAGTIARTADGVNLVDGLRVFTNNLDRGTVDLSRAEWEWHGPENRYHLWFSVIVDEDYTGAQVNPPRPVAQSDDRVATRFGSKIA